MNEQRRSNGMSSHHEYSEETPESTGNVRVKYNLGPSVPFVSCDGTSMTLYPGLISWKFSRVQSTRSMQAIASIDTPTYTDPPLKFSGLSFLADRNSFELSKSAPVHLLFSGAQINSCASVEPSSRIASMHIKSLILICSRD